MKLLTRTIKNYLLFSAVLVCIFTPLFYVAMQKLFLSRMDEELREHREEFGESVTHLKTEEDLELYHLMNREFLLTPIDTLPKQDIIFTEEIIDNAGEEVVPHRILKSGVVINGKNYELQIKESLVDTARLITSIMGIQIIMLTLMLGGFTFINRRLSKIIWGPFYIILDKLKKYHIDQDQALELPKSSTAEFRDLSDVITQLVEKNHEAYLSQKEFTENASHEIQTPLAICRTKLELLSQTKELTQEQAELVGALSEASDRISRLNRNLLLLAKIENQQFREQENIDVVVLTLKLLKQQEEQIKLKNISLVVSHDSSLITKGNLALMEILLTNLITNAIRHTHESSTIDLSIHNGTFQLSNKGISFNYPDKIFDRFHRESKSSNGSGLGLAIAKKICDAEG
ncbi:MAG TPA: HAMP domain-containing sensor histidine kinase, partial [Chryseolinea sp.]|nr:HAMP domain-containing sensor histidine kinase [Chryseolinea sp.]